MKVKTATLGGRKTKIEAARVYGEAYSPAMEKVETEGTAWIWYDSTIGGQSELETIIHEARHIQAPRATEATVTRDAKELARLLWRLGYRKSE